MSWMKVANHNEWIHDKKHTRISMSVELNGVHRGMYCVMYNSVMTTYGTRKIIFEKHFWSGEKALAFTKRWMRAHPNG